MIKFYLSKILVYLNKLYLLKTSFITNKTRNAKKKIHILPLNNNMAYKILHVTTDRHCRPRSKCIRAWWIGGKRGMLRTPVPSKKSTLDSRTKKS